MTDQRKRQFELLFISYLALFLEMLIIRWLASEVRIFAYFKNLPLMAAFLGFGIGFFLQQKSQRIFGWFPVALSYLLIIIAVSAKLHITHVIFVDPRQYFLLGTGFGDHAAQSLPSVLETARALFVIVSIFFLVTLCFATLASKIGELLNKDKPLTGYSTNVAGSLLGIVAFAGISYLQWPPVLWVVCALGPLLYFFRGSMKRPLIYFGAVLVVVAHNHWESPAIWSPYYRITLESDGTSRVVSVNRDAFQMIEDLSPAYQATLPKDERDSHSRHYNLPYVLSKRKIESVLILGGGTGNDAAASLRNGATHVDVVEIDPVIVQIGRELHPEKPYQSERVTVHVDDARSFLHRTRSTYDLVVFATLDSHTVFASMSSIRLDNFVFTRESIASAWEKLIPGGGIAVNFFASKPWLSQRHLEAVEQVSGIRPLVYASPENQEVLLLAGQIFDSSQPLGSTNYQEIPAHFTSVPVEPTTDDWPFLFLEKRGIPLHYLLPLFVILALSFIPLRKSGFRVQQIDWQMFFMGGAFLLLETKAVTTLALVFGSTWMVNSIVLSSILLTILLANTLASRLSEISSTVLYFELFGCLLLNLIVSFDSLNALTWKMRLVVSSLIVASPIFFAALIFARAFMSVESPSLALASNLLGSLAGGLLEYLDMWTGLRWLNLVALLLYLASFLYMSRGARGSLLTEAKPPHVSEGLDRSG